MKKPKKYLPYWMKLWVISSQLPVLFVVLWYPPLILFPPFTLSLACCGYALWQRHRYLSHIKICLKYGIEPTFPNKK